MFADLNALEPLHQDAYTTVWVLEYFEDAPGAATREQGVGIGVLVLSVLLRGQPENTVAFETIVYELEGGLTRD